MADKRKVDVKTKLVLKDIGNPKALGALPDTVQKHVLGNLFGMANDIIIRKMPTGETYEGLKGSFKAVPADAEKNLVQSGICYLPAGLFELVADKVRDPETGEVSGSNVQFAFEVAVTRASNPAGYSWAFTPLVDPEINDPIDDLITSVMGSDAPAIEDQSEEKAADPAPAPAKGKGGAKAAA